MDNDNNYGFNNSDSQNNNENQNNANTNFDSNSGYSDPTDNGNFYNPNTEHNQQNSGYNGDQNYNSNPYNNGGDNNYNGSYNNGGDQNYNYNSGSGNNYSSNPNTNGDYNYSDNNGANNDPNAQKDGDNSQYSQYGGNVQYKWNYDDYEKALHKNKKAKKRGLKPFIITVSCVFGVAIIGLAAYGITSSLRKGGIAKNNGTTNGTSITIESQPSSSTAAPSNGTKLTNEQVAEKLTPAVVGIEMYNLSSVEPIAEGTGIVISEDGYIVTNAHVVADGQKICVVMHDGKKYDTVKLVGKDTKSDLAVLKINATGLTKATFGDSTQLKVGQEVIAIGNPGGLTFANTVTNGIVSGLNRSVSTSTTGNQMTYIQTNALINPGNSGGPLVNMYGQVVGINTAKVTLSGYEGIGFAIPISSAKPYIDSIISNGYVTGRVKVGVSVYALSESQAKWYNYPSGLYIESIEKDSDAYKQGLRSKDIITEINGVALANSDSSTVFKTFYTEESKYKAGQTITVKVYKTESNKTVSISFKLEEDKGDTETTTEQSQQSGNGSGSGYGSGNGNSNENGNSNGYGYGSGSGNSNGNSSDNFWSQFGQ